MSDTMGTLKSLHRMIEQAAELRSRLVRGPRVLAAADLDLKAIRSDLSSAQDQFRRTQLTANEKQGQLKQREARVQDLGVKLNMATKNQEYQAIKEQIAADRAANDVLSDEILELLERSDEIADEIAKVTERLAKAEHDRQQLAGHIDGERAQLEADLARVGEQMTTTLASVPAEFRATIADKIKTGEEDILARLEGKSCGNCNTSLTTNKISRLQIGVPVVCESCRSLVYIPPEANVE